MDVPTDDKHTGTKTHRHTDTHTLLGTGQIHREECYIDNTRGRDEPGLTEPEDYLLHWMTGTH